MTNNYNYDGMEKVAKMLIGILATFLLYNELM